MADGADADGKVNVSINGVSLLSCVLGAYVAGLLALANTRSICNEYECRLVNQGIDSRILNKKTFFGVSYQKTFSLYCTVPVIWGFVIAVLLFYVYYYNNVPSTVGFLKADIHGMGLRKMQLPRIAVVLVINAIVGVASVYSLCSL